MARLLTAGAEAIDDSVEAVFLSLGTTYDATTFRSGARAWKTNSSSGTRQCVFTLAAVTGRTYFLRAYINLGTTITADAGVVWFNDSAALYEARLSTGSTLQLFVNGSAIGSASAALNTATWYRVELAVNVSASASSTYAELLLDGVSLGTSSTINLTSALTQAVFGYAANPGASKIIYHDDVALNDSTGANQNSWPGDGKVVLLKPISDNSAGSWRAGSAASASANGALFNAIDNTPPGGTISPDAVTACISNTISGATAPNGDFNFTTYATAGIGASDTINCLQMTVVHGEDSATGAKTGTFTVVSNPAQGATNAITQFGPAASGAVGAYPSNWVVQQGTIIYGPSVTVGTSPVGRITKTDTGTRAADCCYMGIYVDYTAAVVSDTLLGQACL